MSESSSVAIITGSASGIGRATAIAIARTGCHVICTDIRRADETVAIAVAEGLSAEVRELDVSNNDSWQSLIGYVMNKFGRVDVLASVAGVVAAETDTVLDQVEADWQKIIDVDLKGVWLGMRAVAPHMIAAGYGRIINVASLAGLIGLPNLMAYSAAKAGVIGMSRQAAIQYAGQGLNINVVCPGIIDTPILGDITPDMHQAFIAATPLGKLGRPEDIAASIVHLAGSGGNFVTGQVLTVDGGWSAQ